MRRSARNLEHSSGNHMSATCAMTPKPSRDPAAGYAKGQGIAEIVQVESRGLAALPVSEAAHGPPPSWRSRALGAVLARCKRLIPSLQARDYAHELDDHLLRDIGLLRDQIQPPLLAQWRRPPA
jgi:uncharacterized protein YjiS (DUF1127 family)